MSPVATLPAAFLLALGMGAALAQDGGADYPTTFFEDGATSASVTVGDVTATIDMVHRPRVDPDFDVPVLTVTVGERKVLEAVGVASGFDFPATEASIAEIDPNNARPEVYFTSYSGGAHCCAVVIVATQIGNRWHAVEVGAFDGDGRYLHDVDGDGHAEIVTVDNRFLYEFDCYACSNAPLQIQTVRRGAVVDASAEIQFLPAHQRWLDGMEADWPEGRDRWSKRGFLAGWVAAKQRVGEGLAAWNELDANWNHDADAGEEVCLSGEPFEQCPRRQKAVLKFPDRLKLFLEQNGYPLG